QRLPRRRRHQPGRARSLPDRPGRQAHAMMSLSMMPTIAHLRPLALAITALAALAGCGPLPDAAPPAPTQGTATPYRGTTPSVAPGAAVALAANGDVVLALAQPCVLPTGGLCPAAVLRVTAVVAAMPDGHRIRGTWSDASHVSFRIPWDQSDIDPLAPDA